MLYQREGPGFASDRRDGKVPVKTPLRESSPRGDCHGARRGRSGEDEGISGQDGPNINVLVSDAVATSLMRGLSRIGGRS